MAVAKEIKETIAVTIDEVFKKMQLKHAAQ